MFNPWALHKACEVPERLGDPYIVVFRGDGDAAAIAVQNSVPTPVGVLPLWKGLLAKPDIEIKGTPFVWKHGGVEYRSSCAAFEKNMVLAHHAATMWNKAHGTNDMLNMEYLQEAHAIVNNLLHGGLADDRSLPQDQRLVPGCLRKERLEDLCAAVTSLAAVLCAQSKEVVSHDDELERARLYNYATLRESTLLKKAWYKQQKAMALGCLACAYVRKTGDVKPDRELCLAAYGLLRQALQTRGCPGAEAFKTAQDVCLADLRVIYTASEGQIKALKVARVKNTEPSFGMPALPEWLTAPPDLLSQAAEAVPLV